MISIGRQSVVDYQDLIDEHDAIDRLSLRLEEMAAGGHPDAAGARELLRSLARTVAAHVRREEGFVYPGLAQSDAEGATEAVREFETLKHGWETYLDIWRQDGALDDWAGFAAATPPVLNDLRERALTEIEQLYALALREGLVELVGQPAEREERRRAN